MQAATVIRSFNDNKPFDQFTREQLAGDLLPNPTEDQRIATGFLRLNLMTREGGAQADEYMAKYMGDRIRALGGAWLGLTTGCAECHDHKFDPITAKDYYAMGAFFADIRQWGVYSHYSNQPNPELAGRGNNGPFPPEIHTRNAALLERIQRYQNEIIQVLAAAKKPEHAAAQDLWATQAAAALIKDLKQRGMLEDTLVIWGGEFGRTPMGQGTGRDHHINAFSIWMAGAGIKPGITHGITDEMGYAAVQDTVHVRDLHATLLHQFGIDHSRFSTKFQGLDYKLTGVKPAKPVKAILA